MLDITAESPDAEADDVPSELIKEIELTESSESPATSLSSSMVAVTVPLRSIVEVRNASFADELRAREHEALRLAELRAPVAIVRLDPLRSIVEERNASFADELRAREDEALRLAELGAPEAIARLVELEKLKFADELRAREDEALRLAELGAPVAIARLEKLEKLKFLETLKCEMESEAALAHSSSSRTRGSPD